MARARHSGKPRSTLWPRPGTGQPGDLSRWQRRAAVVGGGSMEALRDHRRGLVGLRAAEDLARNDGSRSTGPDSAFATPQGEPTTGSNVDTVLAARAADGGGDDPGTVSHPGPLIDARARSRCGVDRGIRLTRQLRAEQGAFQAPVPSGRQGFDGPGRIPWTRSPVWSGRPAGEPGYRCTATGRTPVSAGRALAFASPAEGIVHGPARCRRDRPSTASCWRYRRPARPRGLTDLPAFSGAAPASGPSTEGADPETAVELESQTPRILGRPGDPEAERFPRLPPASGPGRHRPQLWSGPRGGAHG